MIETPSSARNVVTLAGAAAAVGSGALFGVLFLLQLLDYLTNPYLGLVVFVALPFVFVLGLVAIPIGIVWARHRTAHDQSVWPRIDLNVPAQRRLAGVVAVVSLVNVVILSTASYGAIHYMESVEFCGTLCHSVMTPEFSSYQASPHAHVLCVDCHIGSGAASFAEAKLSGTRQLMRLVTASHARPIPAPVRSMRPARETCERCHWPEKLHGDKIRSFYEFGDDEANTESVTTLRVHVGGGSETLGVATGIHWHMNVRNVIEYVATDRERQVIPYVRFRDPDGTVREFVAPGADVEALRATTLRRMDCMDCHNRPAHTFVPSPERAVDQALAIGRLDRSLPFLRRELVTALEGGYPDESAAREAIGRALGEFYRVEYPDVAAGQQPAIARAVDVGVTLYGQNVFPDMKVSWGTYPNELGHTDFPGCFRCHDDEHQAADGSMIRQDCEICHDFD